MTGGASDMEREKIKLSIPVAVEGRYDKIKLSGVIDATIITTEGFGIFKSHEKLAVLKKLAENGIVVLTDSDGAGKVIRGYISSAVPKEKIYNLYVPRIEGKEKRKKSPSKEGVLGVEGVSSDMLYSLFADFVKKNGKGGQRHGGDITKADLYEAKLTGAADSKARRDRFAVSVGLPTGMSAAALQSAIAVIMTKEEFFEKINNIFTENANENN